MIRDVLGGLREALSRARRAGLAKSQVLLDPGIGFGKTHAQNFELLARLPELARIGCPIVVGTSRKAFLGAALAREGEPPLPPGERILEYRRHHSRRDFGRRAYHPRPRR